MLAPSLASVTWGPAALTELHEQLVRAGYTHARVAADSADLVSQLFGDVLKGAKYGKTARQLIDVRNQRIADLESQLSKAAVAPAKDGAALERLDDDQKHRIYRLLYVAATAVELLSKSAPAHRTALTELLDKDKTGSFGARGEVADYWKVVSERDQLRAESADKDAIIADLLANAGGAPNEIVQKMFVSSRTILAAEESLVKAVQALKAVPDTEAAAPSQVDEEVKKLTAEKRSVETELKRVQKVFAQHLKLCEENVANSSSLGEIGKQRQKLQTALDRKQEEYTALLQQVHDLELGIAQRDKCIEQMKMDETHFKEELTALLTRCDLFETEFRQLELKRLEDDRKMKLMDTELSELDALRKANVDLESALENAQLSFIDTDRALADARDEIGALRLELEKGNEVKSITDEEFDRLRKQLAQSNAASEKAAQLVRDLKNRLREREIEHARLEQVIELREKTLEENQTVHEEVKVAMKKAQDNEDAAMIEKEEAVRHLEQYRSTAKELKRRIDNQMTELTELKGRNRFLVAQLADRLDPPLMQPPETVSRIQKDCEISEQAEAESELAGLKLENKLLREKLASHTVMLQKAIVARKEAQSFAASEGLSAAKYKAALDDLSDQQLTTSYPPMASSGWSRMRGSVGRQATGAFPNHSSCTPQSTRSQFPLPSRGPVQTQSSSDWPTSSSSESYINYASATTFSITEPSTTGYNIPSDRHSAASRFLPPPNSTSTHGFSIRTNPSSVAPSSFSIGTLASRTPPQVSSVDLGLPSSHRVPGTSGPTPIPKARSPRRQSFTERAMARIQEIMESCDDGSQSNRTGSSGEDATPRHTTSARGELPSVRKYSDLLQPDTFVHSDPRGGQENLLVTSTGTSPASTEDRLPSRRTHHLLNDEEYGHGGGYYWSPPHGAPEEAGSACSLTYTHETTSRSMERADLPTDSSRVLIDGWITERTTNMF